MKEPRFEPTWGERLFSRLPRSFGWIHFATREDFERGDGSTFVRKAYVVPVFENESSLIMFPGMYIPGTKTFVEYMNLDALTEIIEEEWDVDGED